MEDEGPAPICEDFFGEDAHPAIPLEESKPWYAPAGFAVIVHADYAKPTLPDRRFSSAPPEDDVEYLLEPEAQQLEWKSELPPAHEALEFPAEALAYPAAATDVRAWAESWGERWEGFPPADGQEPLEYEAAPESFDNLPIGGRPSLALRPRQRFPYAASQIETNWGPRVEELTVEPCTHADEWGPVEPPQSVPNLEDRVREESASLEPVVRVQLSIGALLPQMLCEGDGEQFEADRFEQAAKSLEERAGLYLDSAYGDWPARPELPRAATRWNPEFHFPKARPAKPMAGLDYPSLFQLNAVLPPRPEGAVHHG